MSALNSYCLLHENLANINMTSKDEDTHSNQKRKLAIDPPLRRHRNEGRKSE